MSFRLRGLQLVCRTGRGVSHTSNAPLFDLFWQPFLGVRPPTVSNGPAPTTSEAPGEIAVLHADWAHLRLQEHFVGKLLPRCDVDWGLPVAPMQSTPAAAAKVIEDWFIVLMSGFDISSIGRTHLTIRHTRNFMGWRPTGEEITLPYQLLIVAETSDGAGGRLLFNNAEPDAPDDSTPTTHLQMRSIRFRADVAAPLSLLPTSPQLQGTLTCLKTPSALQMFVALRRAKVKPDFINSSALLSATTKAPRWASALGMM